MPVPATRPPLLTGRVFRGADAVRRGLLTTDQLRSNAWTHVRQDVYADARIPLDHRLACHAALARLPAGTILAGRSAAFLHGVPHAATYTDAVHIITHPEVRVGVQKHLAVHHLTLAPPDVVSGPLPMTSIARTAWDVARWHDPLEAVPIIDALLRSGRLSALPDLGGYGRRRAQRSLSLTDPAAQSPAESRLRVRLILAGLPRPVTQHPIPIAAGLVLHPDLAWPDRRVALEYDGIWHATTDQLHRDRRRLNQLVSAGWTVLHVTAQRLTDDFPAVLTEIKTALSRPHPSSRKKGPSPAAGARPVPRRKHTTA